MAMTDIGLGMAESQSTRSQSGGIAQLTKAEGHNSACTVSDGARSDVAGTAADNSNSSGCSSVCSSKVSVVKDHDEQKSALSKEGKLSSQLR